MGNGVLFAHGQSVVLWQAHDHTQCATTRNNGGFVNRLTLGHQHGRNGMTGLMVGRALFLVITHNKGATLNAHQHLVLGIFKLPHGDRAAAKACSGQGGLVDQIGEIRARKTGRTTGNNARVHIRCQRHFPHMYTQDFLAPANIGVRHHDLPVKTTGSQQCGVQHIRAVGGGNKDNPFIAFKAVHFHQHLVQGLLALIIATAHASTTMAANGIDFVNKDNARSGFFALLKHVPHAGCTNTYEHFHKVGTGNGEEWHIGLTRNGAGQQGLTRTRRANQQHTFGNFTSKPRKLLRVFEEIHDLLQFTLGLINACHILKCNAAMFFGQHFGTGFAKAHCTATSTLHLAHHKQPCCHQQNNGQGVQEVTQQWATVLLQRFGHNLHPFTHHARDKGGVHGRVGLKRCAIGQRTRNIVILHHNRPDMP